MLGADGVRGFVEVVVGTLKKNQWNETYHAKCINFTVKIMIQMVGIVFFIQVNQTFSCTKPEIMIIIIIFIMINLY